MKKSLLLPLIWKKLAETVRRYPAILGPFILVALIDVLILMAAFLAPQRPLSMVMAPIVRAFWGERFLHYPANFLVLPEVFNRIRNIFSFITGVFLAGIAVSMISQAYSDKKPEWWMGIKKSAKKYLRMVIVWGIIFVCVMAVSRVSVYLMRVTGSRRIGLGLDFSASVIIQMIFVFAIPSIIIENRKVLFSLFRSVALFKRYPLTTFLIVLIPGLLFIPFTVLHLRLPVLMDRLVPEVVLYALFLRIFMLSFIDIIITSSAAILLLKHRETEKGI